jgi:hypothetical protein
LHHSGHPTPLPPTERAPAHDVPPGISPLAPEGQRTGDAEDGALEARPSGTSETVATYRSAHPRRPHPYRGAAVLALALVAGAVATWFAAAEVLLGIEQGAARLRALDSGTSRAITATVLVAAGLLAVIVAWGRATSPRRAVRLADGRGSMAVEAIETRLRYAIVADPDVHEARVWVENRHRRGLGVDVALRVGPRARIDDAIDRVDEVAEELLHRRLGVPMDGPPMVDVTYDELDLRAGRADGARG